MVYIRLQRVYDAPKSHTPSKPSDPSQPTNELRILVDRLWPRGIKKEALTFDIWAKAWAPSTSARKEFDHKPENFERFKVRYTAELDQRPEAFALIDDIRAQNPTNITLLYAAKDPKYNHAVILKQWLEEQLLSLS